MSDMGSPGQGQTGIQVKTSFFFLSFLLLLFKTRITLDGGQPVERKWGETFIPVQPGRHQVSCYCTYPLPPQMGNSSTEVDVAPGQVVRIKWRAPLIVFMKGKWTNGT